MRTRRLAAAVFIGVVLGAASPAAAAPKRAEPAPGPAPSVDIGVDLQDWPDPSNEGQEVVYRFTITNLSSVVATEVVLTDVLPSSVTYRGHSATSDGTCSGTTTVTCTFPTIQSGHYVYATIYVRPHEQGTLTNSGSVRANEADPDTSNNSATATTSVGPPLTGPDSAVSIVTTPARAGEPFTFDVLVTNRGPSGPLGVDYWLTMLTDPRLTMLGALGCEIPQPPHRSSTWCRVRAVAAGETRRIVVVAKTEQIGSFYVEASVGTFDDPFPDDNAASAVVTSSASRAEAVAPVTDLQVRAQADLLLHSGSLWRPQTGYEVLVRVDNDGPSAAPDTTLRYDTPPLASVTVVDAGGMTCSTGVQVVCSTPSLAPGSAREVRLMVKAPTGVHDNHVSATTGGIDREPLDNHAVAPVVVDETGMVAIMLGSAQRVLEQVAELRRDWCGARPTTPVVCRSIGPRP